MMSGPGFRTERRGRRNRVPCPRDAEKQERGLMGLGKYVILKNTAIQRQTREFRRPFIRGRR